MAQDAVRSIDMMDIQFKLRDKFELYNGPDEPRSNVNLLAISSSRGLLFAGNPIAAQLKVLIIKQLVDARSKEQTPQGRLVPLPAIPNYLACSADGNLLAINFTLNAAGFLNIYSVPSFTTPNIKPMFTIRLSPDDHVHAVQLLWNPVLPNSLAVVLSNGALCMYALKDGSNFEMHTLDKSQQVKCGCWSPKGKQIVLGYPNGKLQQYKPDLTLAKTILCPANVHGLPFDTIALHWLSVYQFAVVFLQHGEDCAPSLYIVHAPKAATPTYLNCSDICYSGNGPRNHQFNFTHVPQWNILLVTSANGIEVGVLGTTETGDAPTWQVYLLVDEARIEMPLKEKKYETFPMGFVFDTSSTHQLVVSEQKLPVMPMIHVLSTAGMLISFDFLNLCAEAASVCSPPPPIADTSGQFRDLPMLLAADSGDNGFAKPIAPSQPALGAATPDISFSITQNTMTSTPTPAQKDKSAAFFGGFGSSQAQTAVAPTLSFSSNNKPALGFGFGGGTAGNTVATNSLVRLPMASNPPVANFGALAKPTEPTNVVSSNDRSSPTPTVTFALPKPRQQQVSVSVALPSESSIDLSKPLYTVPGTFTAPNVQATAPAVVAAKTPSHHVMSEIEIDSIVQQIMAVQINGFNDEILQVKKQTANLLAQIGNPAELKSYTKRLNDLQELNEQAKDRDFELDLMNLRQTLNESYAMLTECRAKLDVFKNPDMSHLIVTNNFDPISHRQLQRLQSYLAANEAQLQFIQQQIDTQWSEYQDTLRRNSKTKMHMPCLEGLYQRMTKLQNLLGERRIILNNIKTKLRDRGLLLDTALPEHKLAKINGESSVDSLAESILSMSLAQSVDNNQSKLRLDKLQTIRKLAQQQKTRIIKPQRPNRVGLKSEVILETKLRTEKQTQERQAVLNTKMITQPASSTTANKIHNTAAPATAATTKAAPLATMAAAVVKVPSALPAPPKPTPIFGSTITNKAPIASFSFNNPVAFVPEPAKQFDLNGFGATTASGTPSTFSFGQTIGFGNVAQAKPIATSADSLFAGTGNNLTVTKVTAPKPKADKEASMAAADKPVDLAKPFQFAGLGGTTSQISTPTIGIGAGGGGGGGGVDATNKQDEATKPSMFGGFGSAAAAPVGSVLNFGGFGASLSETATAGVVTSTATATSNVASLLTPKPSFSFNMSSANSTANMNSLTTSASSKNLFAGFGKTGDTINTATGTTSIFGSTTISSVPPNAFVVGTTNAKPNTSSGIATSTTTTTTTAATSATTSSSTPSVTSTLYLPSSPGSSSVSVASTSSNASTPPRAVVTAAATSTTAATTVSAADSVDNLFGNVAICKPTTQTDAPDSKSTGGAGNIFGGFSTSSDGGSGGSTFGFGSTAKAADATFGAGIASSTVSSVFGTGTATATASTITTTTSTAGSTAAPTTSSFSFTSAFSNLGGATTATTSATEAAPAATAITAPAFAATPATTGTSIFGAAAATHTSPFQQAITSSAPAKPSIFATGTNAAASGGSIFATAATAATPAATPVAATPFGGAATTPAATTVPSTVHSGNIFGGIPKPDQSVFGGAGGGSVFATAAAANPSPFGVNPSAGGAGASSANIFGGGGAAAAAKPNAFGTAGGGSVFGGGGASATSPFGGGGSVFGNVTAATPKPAETGGGIFATNNQMAAGVTSGGGSIFGQSTFGAQQAANNPISSGGNVFATAVSGGTTSPQQASVFGGSGASIFGGGGANTHTANSSGGSIFGGSTSPNVFGSVGGGGFGSFGQTNTGGGGSAFGGGGGGGGGFAQGGASVAQTGFGSPTQQQPQQQQATNAFSKPVFGGSATFGSPTPAFGSPPTFGGAATFGSPKAFGSFGAAAAPANTATPPAFGAPPQKNSLFESLGANDSAVSFGTLAQPGLGNAQKPTFGGSSFMNYRA